MKPNEHVQDDTLEAYVLGRLGEEELDFVEDHMLVCEGCRLRLVEMESFVKATRLAAMRIREKNAFRPAAQTLVALDPSAPAGKARLGRGFRRRACNPLPSPHEPPEPDLRAGDSAIGHKGD